MSLITRCQKSKAVYWAPKRVAGELQTDDSGNILYSSPREITCRKEEEQKEVITREGTSVLSTAYYITEILTEPGGFIVEATLQSITTPTRPKEVRGAKEILAVADTPNLKYRENLYEAFV